MEFPALYILDEENEATGTVLFFCSDVCRTAHKELITEPTDEGMDSFAIDDTVCDHCGVHLT